MEPHQKKAPSWNPNCHGSGASQRTGLKINDNKLNILIII